MSSFFKLSTVLAIVAMGALAQNRPPLHYDPATEVTLSGTVSAVTPQARGQGMGVHLTLTTDSGTVTAMLGPQRFLDSNQFKIEKGDRVEVTGSKMGSMLMVREIKKGDRTLILRDKQGIPAWSSGGGPGPGSCCGRK